MSEQIVEQPSSGLPDITSVSGALQLVGNSNEKVGTYVRNLLVTYAIASNAYSLGKRWFQKAKRHMTYSVIIREDDQMYTALTKWIVRNVPAKDQRSFVLHTRRTFTRGSYDGGAKTFKTYDGSQPQSTVIGGHKVKIHIESVEDSDNMNLGFGDDLALALSSAFKSKEKQIRLECSGLEAVDAIEQFLMDLAKETFKKEKTPYLFLSTMARGFVQRQDLPSRPLETIVLREGQKERLVEDIQSFRDNEDRYVKLGIPYHRGYLLTGPPGTGKTSVARGLAEHFKMDLYYITLGDLASDTSLLDLVAEVEAGSMLLLEDIDVFKASKSREVTKDFKDKPFNGVTLTGLLNSLDGVATPHGLITVMTTNHADSLDPALLRPGRIDLVEHINYAKAAQVANLFDLFYGEVPEDIYEFQGELCPANIVEAMKTNFSDPEQAWHDLLYMPEDALTDHHDDSANVSWSGKMKVAKKRAAIKASIDETN